MFKKIGDCRPFSPQYIKKTYSKITQTPLCVIIFDFKIIMSKATTYISSIDSPLYAISYFFHSCVAPSITSAFCFNTPMLISSA